MNNVTITLPTELKEKREQINVRIKPSKQAKLKELAQQFQVSPGEILETLIDQVYAQTQAK